MRQVIVVFCDTTYARRYVLENVQSEDTFIYNNKKRTSVTDSFIYTIICEEFSMRNT